MTEILAFFVGKEMKRGLEPSFSNPSSESDCLGVQVKCPMQCTGTFKQEAAAFSYYVRGPHRSLQVPFGGVSHTSEPAMTQTKDGLHQAATELSHHRITETGQGTSQAHLKSEQGG